MQVRRAAPVCRCAPSCWGTVAGTEDRTHTAGPAHARAAETLLCFAIIDRSHLPWVAVFFSSAFQMRLQAGTAFALSQLCMGPPVLGPSWLWSLQQGWSGEGCSGSLLAGNQPLPAHCPGSLSPEAAAPGFRHVFLRANCTGSLQAQRKGRDMKANTRPLRGPEKPVRLLQPPSAPSLTLAHIRTIRCRSMLPSICRGRHKAPIWMVFCARCPQVPQGRPQPPPDGPIGGAGRWCRLP